MKTLMIIETAHGGMFFSLTYLAAMLLTAGMTIFFGFRKGYPKSTWLLILITGLLFFIIGEKVASYSSGQWAQVFTSFQLPKTDKKTILGGIIGLFVGLILAKHCLRFNRPVLDSFAVALPLAMAISRIGCLMAGCCFGTPTNLPWGIQYDASSRVYQVHLEEGLIHFQDKTSLAVHPVQLYQVIGCLFIALIVWRTRKQWKASGSLFLFSVLCYALFRFFIEFVRDPASSFIMTQVVLGLKTIQWMILATIISGVSILAARETKAQPVLRNFKPIHVSDMRQVLLMTLLCIIVFSGRKWFGFLEISTILIFLFPVILIQFLELYRKHTVTGFRWVFPFLFICCFSFMSQKSSPTGNVEDKITFTSVGLTGMVGSYYESLEKLTQTWIPPSECGGGYWSKEWVPMGSHRRTFYQGGIDVAYNKWRGKYYKFIIGARGFLGSESAEVKTAYPSGTSFGISPYVGLNWHWVGFTYGLSIGKMKVPLENPSTDPYSYNEGDVISPHYRNLYVLPSISVRAGPYDILYAEAGFPMVFPSTSPIAMVRTGIGSGLGKTNGTKVSAGYCYPGIYAQTVFPIKDKIVLEGLYADNLSSGINSKRVFTFGINYRFSYKKTTIETVKKNIPVRFPPLRPFPKSHDTVSDIDGNFYHTVALGGRIWMAENLKVSHFLDRSEIPDATREIQGSGRQYNWHAVNNSKNLCPKGWHVPSLDEWKSLINSLGGEDVAGRKMEEGFSTKGKVSQWWSSTEQDTLHAQSLYLNNQTIGIMFTGSAKTSGLSVRCMRNY